VVDLIKIIKIETYSKMYRSYGSLYNQCSSFSPPGITANPNIIYWKFVPLEDVNKPKQPLPAPSEEQPEKPQIPSQKCSSCSLP
jgi:hypothetical protein